MIKARATGPNGRTMLILGLTFANLETFRTQPGDTFIRIDGQELGLPIDVMIFSGETEAKLTELIQPGLGPNTKVNISDKLKS